MPGTSIARDSLELFLSEYPVAPFGAVVHRMVEAYFTDVDGNVLRFGETVE